MKNRHFSLLIKYAIAIVLSIPCIGAGNRADAADYSFGDGASKNAACIACHSDQSKVSGLNLLDQNQFGHTTHAKFGCTTCHETITSEHPGVKSAANTTSCGDCHGDTTSQYSASVHAKNAPCSGCHNPHRVNTAIEIPATEMNKQCAVCHTSIKITASHAKWLPQTGLHLGAIACITCHSKAENFVISIYIAKRDGADPESKPTLMTYEELHIYSKDEDVQYLIDRNKDHYISLDELRKFNNDSSNKDMYLKAMFTPVKPTHSFQTFDNRWDCTFCHASGSEIMQTSYLSFPKENGVFQQVAVEKGAALDALRAIPNFYLMGSTRNGTLNIIGSLIIVGGLIMPVGHGFLRFLSRKNRQ
ncbi:MAG: cytochrome c3 family protein [Desulfuromonadaceae bacterium]|nr:cytochrome c3 family protein [Desulfuromonadaceae bacterium]MDD5107257.1 cytochrome c3 family protein [Desulfuromonadaceae bacterium]